MRVNGPVRRAERVGSKFIGALALFGFVSVACNTSVRGNNENAGTETDPTAPTTGGLDSKSPTEACQDIATDIANEASECGYNFTEAYDAVQDQVAGGDCGNATNFRDRASFFAECVPAIKKIKCSAGTFGAGYSLPVSCSYPFYF